MSAVLQAEDPTTAVGRAVQVSPQVRQGQLS